MTATLDARYRRIAVALEQRGMEVKLLDTCGCYHHYDHGQYIIGLRERPDYIGHSRIGCGKKTCDGTVVPSQEVCFWRLVIAVKHFLQIIPRQPEWLPECKDWKVRWDDLVWGEGTDPLDALMLAVEQSLGLSKN